MVLVLLLALGLLVGVAENAVQDDGDCQLLMFRPALYPVRQFLALPYLVNRAFPPTTTPLERVY